MTDQNLTTEEIFQSALDIVRNLPKDGPIKPSDELKLKFYAYFKQASHGINDTLKPRFYQIVELYKWDAWKKLGSMSKEDAMLNYIKELKNVMETVPKDTDTGDTDRYKQVLGTKFYDYWFSEWQKLGMDIKDVDDDHDATDSNDSYVTSREELDPIAFDLGEMFSAALIRLQRNLYN